MLYGLRKIKDVDGVSGLYEMPHKLMRFGLYLSEEVDKDTKRAAIEELKTEIDEDFSVLKEKPLKPALPIHIRLEEGDDIALVLETFLSNSTDQYIAIECENKAIMAEVSERMGITRSELVAAGDMSNFASDEERQHESSVGRVQDILKALGKNKALTTPKRVQNMSYMQHHRKIFAAFKKNLRGAIKFKLPTLKVYQGQPVIQPQAPNVENLYLPFPACYFEMDIEYSNQPEINFTLFSIAVDYGERSVMYTGSIRKKTNLCSCLVVWENGVPDSVAIRNFAPDDALNDEDYTRLAVQSFLPLIMDINKPRNTIVTERADKRKGRVSSKGPFFDYHTVEVVEPLPEREDVPTQVGFPKGVRGQLVKRSAPRMHERRAHMRRKPGEAQAGLNVAPSVKVSATTVGEPGSGVKARSYTKG
tara:strand:+ start:447 stop:1703 length:1257 start_codon:yes stop_codon:yes gene_type:complete